MDDLWNLPVSGNDELLLVLAAFERQAEESEAAPPVAALPAFAGTVRAVGAVLQASVALVRQAGAPDPLGERPRILRAA